MCVAWKWLGGKTKVMACDTHTEREVLAKVHGLLDEADIVVGQNGDAFDIKKLNSRFIVYKMKPPAPYRTVDTKKVAKGVAAFDSNSLDNLGRDLDEGRKLENRGFDMWEGCLAGKHRDWRDMKRYNKHDVDLLERIYLRLRPWIKNFPVEYEACRCGSTRFQKHGLSFEGKKRYLRLQCNGCGAWRRGDVDRAGTGERQKAGAR